MRICMYQTMPRSGVAYYGHCLAEDLGGMGHEVDLLTTQGYEYQGKNYRVFPGLRPFGNSRNKVLRKLSSLWSYWVHVVELLRFVRNAPYPYDVVHIQVPYILFHWLFVPLLQRHCKRVVATVHDVIPHQPILHRRLDLILSQWTFASFHRLIVHSEENRRQMLTTFRIEDRRVAVVPHGVFYYGSPGQGTFNPYGLNEGFLNVLFFGGLRPNKGLHLLLESLKSVRSARVCVLIAGAGNQADAEQIRRVQQELQAAGLDHKIIWMNRFIDDAEIPDIFSGADVVVLPYTTFASQSGVLNVAIGYERPVIVTDVGSMGATIREFGNGLVVPPGRVEELAAALERVHVGSEAYDRAVAGARVARVALDWAQIASRTTTEVYS